MLTQNYKAEYEKASSAVITAVTKSGGNTWSGEVFIFYQDKNLVEQDEFARARATCPSRPTTAGSGACPWAARSSGTRSSSSAPTRRTGRIATARSSWAAPPSPPASGAPSRPTKARSPARSASGSFFAKLTAQPRPGQAGRPQLQPAQRDRHPRVRPRRRATRRPKTSATASTPCSGRYQLAVERLAQRGQRLLPALPLESHARQPGPDRPAVPGRAAHRRPRHRAALHPEAPLAPRRLLPVHASGAANTRSRAVSCWASSTTAWTRSSTATRCSASARTTAGISRSRPATARATPAWTRATGSSASTFRTTGARRAG